VSQMHLLAMRIYIKRIQDLKVTAIHSKESNYFKFAVATVEHTELETKILRNTETYT
jgi:hypothetical protein